MVANPYRSELYARTVMAGTAMAGVLALAGCSGSGPEDAPSSSPAASPSPEQFVEGCDIYGVYSQNQFDPVGTAVREEPSRLAPKAETVFGLNETIPVDGWFHSGSGPNYPTNQAPLNTDIWFHVAHTGGYVSFEGVRGVPTSPTTPMDTPDLLAELKPECEYQHEN